MSAHATRGDSSPPTARGAAALAHGNRRRRPHNAVPAHVASTVVRLATTNYPGANRTYLAELLWEHEGPDLSSWTVRRILTRAGIPSPRRRRPPEHRVRGERMAREGMLLQIDGSHHAWLEERAPRFALLLAVDVGPSVEESLSRRQPMREIAYEALQHIENGAAGDTRRPRLGFTLAQRVGYCEEVGRRGG